MLYQLSYLGENGAAGFALGSDVQTGLLCPTAAERQKISLWPLRPKNMKPIKNGINILRTLIHNTTNF
jgi:hypothetical protein